MMSTKNIEAADFKLEIRNSDPEILMGYLRVLYNGQTEDEQIDGGVVYKNHIGFNRFDASRMTRIFKKYDSGHGVNPVDLQYLRLKLPKYHAQLKRHRVIPVPVPDEIDHGTVKEHVETKDIPHNEHSHEPIKIKLSIPQSHYNVNGFHYSLKQGDIAEIPHDKANRLIAAGFALKVDGVKI